MLTEIRIEYGPKFPSERTEVQNAILQKLECVLMIKFSQSQPNEHLPTTLNKTEIDETSSYHIALYYDVEKDRTLAWLVGGS